MIRKFYDREYIGGGSYIDRCDSEPPKGKYKVETQMLIFGYKSTLYKKIWFWWGKISECAHNVPYDSILQQWQQYYSIPDERMIFFKTP
jgi:hypothetical protein